MAIEHIENTIIGAGPAGLQMAYEFKKRQQPFLLLEANDQPASFFSRYPKNRQLISVNKTHCGNLPGRYAMRHDWNSLLTDHMECRLGQFSQALYPKADDLVSYLKTFYERYGINQHTRFNHKVIRIDKESENDPFVIHYMHNDKRQQLNSTNIFYAGGIQPKESPDYLTRLSKQLSIPLLTYKDIDLNPEQFTNKNVLIVGAGNAAFEIANWMAEYANNIEITGTSHMAWRTHYPGHLRSINFKFLDAYYLKSKGICHWYRDDIETDDTPPLKHAHDQNEKHKEESITQLIHNNHQRKQVNQDIGYDYLIQCCGFYFDDSVFSDKIKPKILDNGFPALTPDYRSTNTEQLYFIGALMQGDDYKTGTSAFIHGFRYNIEFLAKQIHNEIQTTVLDINTLPNYIFNRLNFDDTLFQRFNDYCDVVAWDTDNPVTINYYHALPISFAIKHLPEHKKLCIKLGYGEKKLEWTPYQKINDSYPHLAHNCLFLHPMLEFYETQTPEKSHTFHIVENVYNTWGDDPIAHQMPLRVILEGLFHGHSLRKIQSDLTNQYMKFHRENYSNR